MLLILFIFIIVLLLYFYLTKDYNYWKIRNVKHNKPALYFGSLYRSMFRMISFNQLLSEQYNKYNEEKVVGMFVLTKPMLLVKDLEIIRRILTQDFSHFYIRGAGRNRKRETLHRNVVFEEGDEWKLLRQRLSPVFTSAKLRAMFPLIVRCANRLQKRAEEIELEGGDCDVYKLIVRYSCEFVGTCGFGIDMDAINDQHSLFYKIADLIEHPTLKTCIKRMLWETCPLLRPYLYVSDPRIRDYITNVVQEVMKQRNYKPSPRNDYLDSLIKLYNEGVIKGDSMLKKNDDGTPATAEMKVDLPLIVAQVFVFFAAGFETSAISMSHALHQLAFNPEVQKRVQEDIDKVMMKHKNELNYDAIAEMNLLKMSFYESMRMFSPATLFRVCTKTYTISELNLTIDPGVSIVIPLQAIQNDPKYFENPGEFIPERFSTENVHRRHKFAFLPFGEGPRNCVGSRMGEMQSLAGLAAILSKFSVEPSNTSRRELKVDHTRNVVHGVVGGMPLRLRLRENKTM